MFRLRVFLRISGLTRGNWLHYFITPCTTVAQSFHLFTLEAHTNRSKRPLTRLPPRLPAVATEDAFCLLHVLHVASNMMLCGILGDSYYMWNYLTTCTLRSKEHVLSDKAVFFYIRRFLKNKTKQENQPWKWKYKTPWNIHMKLFWFGPAWPVWRGYAR